MEAIATCVYTATKSWNVWVANISEWRKGKKWKISNISVAKFSGFPAQLGYLLFNWLDKNGFVGLSVIWATFCAIRAAFHNDKFDHFHG